MHVRVNTRKVRKFYNPRLPINIGEKKEFSFVLTLVIALLGGVVIGVSFSCMASFSAGLSESLLVGIFAFALFALYVLHIDGTATPRFSL